jgi:prepilin-type N-terminal cleavage/methylation domain-containing protein
MVNIMIDCVRPIRAAFTMLEVMVVITIIAILAAIVVPKFDGLSDDARSAAAVSAVGGVRASIATFRTRRVISGDDPFPTLADLGAPGEVLAGPLPVNPYTGQDAVVEVSESDADARRVTGVDQYGWCYFVDNESDPPRAVIYLNSEDPTRVENPDGSFKTANQL